MRKLALVAVSGSVAFGTSPIYAQPPKYDVGVGLAMGHVQAREDLVAPLVFQGPAGALTASFAGRAETSELDSRLLVAPVMLRDRYHTLNAAMSVGVDGRWRFDVSHGSHGVVRVGGMLDVHSWLGYYEAWDDAHAYWLSVISAGPSLQLVTRAPGGRDWAMDLEVPVIAVASRPPRYRLNKADDLVDFGFWVSRVADGPRVTTLHEYVAGRFRTCWRGRKLGFRVDPWIGFDLESYSVPEWVAHVTYWVGAEARWGL